MAEVYDPEAGKEFIRLGVHFGKVEVQDMTKPNKPTVVIRSLQDTIRSSTAGIYDSKERFRPYPEADES